MFIPNGVFFRNFVTDTKLQSGINFQTSGKKLPNLKFGLGRKFPNTFANFLPDENFKLGTFFLGHQEFIPAKSHIFDIPNSHISIV